MWKNLTILSIITNTALSQPGAFNLVSPSNGSWVNTTPTFNWNESVGASSYRLFLDAIMVKDGLTVHTFRLPEEQGLSKSLHTWNVEAVDLEGVTNQSSQTFSIKVDGVLPSEFNITTPADSLWTNNLSPVFSWTAASDAESGMKRYELWIDGTKTGVKINNSIVTDIPISQSSAEYAGLLTRGIHFWQILAVDSTGNARISAETRTIRVDCQAPLFPIDTVINPVITINWGYNTNVNCKWAILDASNQVLASKNYVSNSTGSRYSEAPTLIFLPGHYRFVAYGNNGWGWSQDGGGNFTINNTLTGSGTYNVSKSEGYGDGRTVTFSVGIDGSGKFKPGNRNAYNYDSLTIPVFSWNPVTDTNSGWKKYQVYIDDKLIGDDVKDTFFISPTPLGFGPHTWYVNAIDCAGNATPMYPQKFFIDNIPPRSFDLRTPIDNSIVSLPTPTLGWQAASDSATGASGGVQKYRVWINDIVAFDSISDTVTAPRTALNEGVYRWYVDAYDAAGNIRRSKKTGTFIVDYNPPGVFTLVLPANNDTVFTPRPMLTWQKAIDAGSGVKAYVVSISGKVPDTIPASDTSVYCRIPLSEGTYTWQVTALDKSNSARSTEARQFIIKTSEASAPTLAFPANGSSSQPLTIAISWNAVADASDYWVQISTDINFTDSRPLWNVNKLAGAKAVAWGNGRFVCVGKGGMIRTSPDGLYWTAQTPVTTNDLYSVTFGNEKFVAVGKGEIAIVSTDGLFWTITNSVANSPYSLKSVTFGNGRFVAVGSPNILVSPDGSLWSKESTGNTGNTSLCYATAGDGTFMILDETNFKLHVYSTEPAWHDVSHAQSMQCVSYGAGVYVGANNASIFSSPNAIDWTITNNGNTSYLSYITYTSGKFIATSYYPCFEQGCSKVAGPVFISADGISWTIASTGSTAVVNQIALGNNRMVAVDGDSTLLTSPLSFNIANYISALPSKELPELMQNTTYYWRVCARHADGVDLWSTTWCFSTLLKATYPPSRPTIVSPISSNILICDSLYAAWSQPGTDIDKYRVTLSTDSLFNTVAFADSSAVDTSVILRGLQDKVTYWFRVQAHNTIGWGDWSGSCKFLINCGQTALSYQHENSFSFGAISHNGVFISYSHPSTADIFMRLFNLQGKLIYNSLVKKQKAGSYSMSINKILSDGIYLVDFNAGKFSVKRTLTICR